MQNRIFTGISIYVVAFLLHFVWEMWQVPFFEGMSRAAHWDALLFCTRASLGDGFITLVAFLVASFLAGWCKTGKFRFPLRGWLSFLATGLLLTIVFELLATKYLDRWQYSDLMPVLPYLEVGLVPLLQWLALPPLSLWLSLIFLRGLTVGKSQL
jgi:hypothetical protein